MLAASDVIENMMFGGQGVNQHRLLPAQKTSSGRVVQRKRKTGLSKSEMDMPATLPNETLGEKVTEVDVGLYTAPKDPLLKKHLRAQTPKIAKSTMNLRRPNVRRAGPIQQPKQGPF